uniref:Group 3 secretory phospholipase A2 n=1 Tax=Pogona vitticeps TaxID=103695 RepID=A0A6J0UE97_9SAUR
MVASARLLLLLLPWLVAALAVPEPGGGARGWWSPATTSCPTVATAPGGAKWLSFLWRRPDGRPPALVQSVWDPRGRLLACAWRTEGTAIRWYRGWCAAAGSPGPGRAVGGPELARWLEALEARKGVCTGAQHHHPPEEEEKEAPQGALGPPAPQGRMEPKGRPRVRRGWTMPGTLWCGAGDSAANASELGVFQGPDVCCREHDLCEAQIAALGYKYGMRNYRLHTISHCDCDERFRQCLRDLNDPISNFIGISFFNLLEVPCFVLEESEECLEWHWWGGCKAYGLMPLAHLVSQAHYQPLLLSTEGPGPATTPARPRKRKGKGRKRHRKNRKNRKRFRSKATEAPGGLHPEPSGPWGSVAAPTPVLESDLVTWSPLASSSGPTPRWTGTLPPLQPTLEGTSEPGLWKTGVGLPTDPQNVQQTHTGVSGLPKGVGQKGKPVSGAGGHGDAVTSSSSAPSQSCSCYRRLDQCPYRIAPHEVKYQLHNTDSRTLFHCNCTRRLARFLRRNQGPNEVEGEVLSSYVSSSCFVLQPPPGCLEGQEEWPNCIDVGKAIVAPARHLTNHLMRRHPGPSLKVKRQEQQPAPPGGSFRLFDRCMQLARSARRAGSR